MFNDLNNPNAQRRPAVDDIFAETDKTNMGGGQSDIETHRVGLVATGDSLPPIESEQPTGGNKKFKIIIIVVVALAVLGGAYFTYSQFLVTKSDGVDLNTNINKEVPKKAPSSTPVKTDDSGFVPVVPGSTSSTPKDIPSEQTPPSPIIATTTPDNSFEALIDSDNDGLTDIEEKNAASNPNIIDTDSDGLSDYEEVKIYLTNPLVADTDSDGYLDGAEVRGGYNPNGPGKLPGNSPKQ